MKNIEQILDDAGVDVSLRPQIVAEVNKNYRTIADYKKQVAKAKESGNKIEAIRKFVLEYGKTASEKGVDFANKSDRR